jgi:predicted nucleic acid-binding protein
MFRVVLDTSVVIAAARSQRGASSLLIDWLDDGRFDAVISYKLILEYEMTLRREIQAGGWSDADVTDFLDFMCTAGQRIAPLFLLRPLLTDPNDEFIVGLAFAARVDYVVTHNVRDFKGSEPFGIEAIHPGQFVKILRGDE